MNKILRSSGIVVVVATSVLVARPAFSDENTLGAVFPSLATSGYSGSLSLATTAGLLPLATTGAVIYFVVVKKDDKGGGTTPQTTEADAGGGYVMNEAEAEKWAELYVRDNNEQLITDISRGYGPTLDDLASRLQINAQHRALFGATLQANASELLPYANKNTLNGKRAAAFFTRMGQLLRNDGALKADLASIRI